MLLNERIALSNGNLNKTLLALRFVNQCLERKLRERLATEEAKLLGVEYYGSRPNGRANHNHNGKKMKTTILLERVAQSNGDLQRTIAALRLLNESLEHELSHFSVQPASDLITLTAILDKKLARAKVKTVVEINGRVRL